MVFVFVLPSRNMPVPTQPAQIPVLAPPPRFGAYKIMEFPTRKQPPNKNAYISLINMVFGSVKVLEESSCKPLKTNLRHFSLSILVGSEGSLS